MKYLTDYSKEDQEIINTVCVDMRTMHKKEPFKTLDETFDQIWILLYDKHGITEEKRRTHLHEWIYQDWDYNLSYST